MALNINPDEKQVSLIAKHPLAYIVGVLVLLLGIFVGSTFLSQDGQVDSLKEQVIFERRRADNEAAARIKADADKYNMARELLEANRILGFKKELIDSTVRNTINR